ncbi:RNA-directed DNA polymerase, eukaryota [Tanacetum coccineum]
MMSPHHRRSFMSNEDYTQKISHSIYVTNFPDSINSRDLWRECSVYGTMVDVFIPLKKSQAGKRFAFVRFIKVFNLDRLGEESFKIIVKGKVFMIRAKQLFTWNPSFAVNKETSSSSDDESVQASDVEGVAETIFDDNSVSSKFYSGDSGKQNLEGPFKLYDLLDKKKSGGVLHVPSPSLSHPPGFTPVVNPDIENDIVHNKGDANGPLVNESSPLIDARMSNSS